MAVLLKPPVLTTAGRWQIFLLTTGRFNYT